MEYTIDVKETTELLSPQRPQTTNPKGDTGSPGLPAMPMPSTLTVGSNLDQWCKDKKVPELSPMQREGVMFILQSVSDRLMSAIDEFRGEAYDVVARFFPPGVETLASVTSTELANHLDGFKEQVQKCVSLESLSFFNAASRGPAIANALKKTKKRPFGQVCWLRCNGDHKVHVFMNDEDTIRKNAGAGLMCMFCDKKTAKGDALTSGTGIK